MQDFESSISQFTLNPMYIDMLKKIILFSYIEMYVGMYTWVFVYVFVCEFECFGIDPKNYEYRHVSKKC